MKCLLICLPIHSLLFAVLHRFAPLVRTPLLGTKLRPCCDDGETVTSLFERFPLKQLPYLFLKWRHTFRMVKVLKDRFVEFANPIPTAFGGSFRLLQCWVTLFESTAFIVWLAPRTGQFKAILLLHPTVPRVVVTTSLLSIPLTRANFSLL